MKYFLAGMRGGLAAACLTLMLLAGPGARAQAPAWQSAVATLTTSTSTPSRITATVPDGNGNVYMAGYFEGTANFGSTMLTSAGNSDGFVAKWNIASARFVWVLPAGGTGQDQVMALATDGPNVYVTGYFADAAASFGPFILNNVRDHDGFVAKVADSGATGSFVWVQALGGPGREEAAAIAVRGPTLYVAGSFDDNVLFGSTALATAGSADVFVTALADQGTGGAVTWARRAGGSDYDYAAAVAVNGTSVYVGGAFLSPTLTVGSTVLTNTNNNVDTFVAKLTDAGSSGSFVWGQRAGGTGTDAIRALAVNGTSVYLAGSFVGSATVGSATLTSAGLLDMFVAKLTDAGSSGSFAWAQRAGGTDNDQAVGLALSPGSVYVTGNFKNTADFGPATLTSAGNYDGYVARIADTGSNSSFAWTLRAGGPDIDAPVSVAIIGNALYVAGYVTPPASFGSAVVNAPAGTRASFLAALSDPTLTATTPALAGAAFTLAPNPARASTTVTLPALPGAATATLLLRDALGRTIRTATVALPPAGLRHELSLAGLAPGLYALQVRAGEATATRRLVVE